MGDLTECFYELDTLERYIKMHWDNEREGELDTELMLLLVRIAQAKIDYFQSRYNLEIDTDDVFLVRQVVDFFSQKTAVDAEREKERRKSIEETGETAFPEESGIPKEQGFNLIW